MELLKYLERIKISEATYWTGQLRLFFTKNKLFWQKVNNQSNAANLRQILFYFLLANGLFILFITGSTFSQAISIAFNEFSIQFVYVFIVLYMTSYCLRKDRVSKNSIFRDVFWLVAFTTIIIYPTRFLLIWLFLSLEAYWLLFFFNVLSLLAALYFYVYSGFLFYRKWRTRIVSIFLNFAILNILTLLVLNTVFRSEKAERILEESLLDPISNEYFAVLNKSRSLTQIPIQKVVLQRPGSEEYRVKIIEQDTILMEIARGRFLPGITKGDVSMIGFLISAPRFQDTLNNYIKHNDSLMQICKFEFSKTALVIKKNYYKKLQNLLTHSNDMINNPIPLDTTWSYWDVAQRHLVRRNEYDVLESSYMLKKEMDRNFMNYKKRVYRAYSPSMILTYFFYMPAYLVSNMSWLKSNRY